MLTVSCVDSRGIHLSITECTGLFLYRFTVAADAHLPRPPLFCEKDFTRFYISPGTCLYSDTFLKENTRYYYRLATPCGPAVGPSPSKEDECQGTSTSVSLQAPPIVRGGDRAISEWVGEPVTAISANKKGPTSFWISSICTDSAGSHVSVVFGPIVSCPNGEGQYNYSFVVTIPSLSPQSQPINVYVTDTGRRGIDAISSVLVQGDEVNPITYYSYDWRTGYVLVVYPVTLPPLPIPQLTATLSLISSSCCSFSMTTITVPIDPGVISVVDPGATCPILTRLFPPSIVAPVYPFPYQSGALALFASSLSPVSRVPSCFLVSCDPMECSSKCGGAPRLPKSPFPIYAISFEVSLIEDYLAFVTIEGPTGTVSTILFYFNGMVRYGYTSGILKVRSASCAGKGNGRRWVTAYVIVPTLPPFSDQVPFNLTLQYSPVVDPSYLYPPELVSTGGEVISPVPIPTTGTRVPTIKPCCCSHR